MPPFSLRDEQGREPQKKRWPETHRSHQAKYVVIMPLEAEDMQLQHSQEKQGCSGKAKPLLAPSL